VDRLKRVEDFIEKQKSKSPQPLLYLSDDFMPRRGTSEKGE